MGVSVFSDYLLSQQRNAVNITNRQTKFKTKHLNVWVSAGDVWINSEQWKNCADSTLLMDDFKSDDCWFCLDLASKLDICAFVILFRRVINGQNHYFCFGRYYLPEDTVEFSGKNKAAYNRWSSSGYLELTDGAEIDFNNLREEVSELAGEFQVNEIPYDKWRATQLAQQLTDEGATCVEISQGYALSPAMRELEAAIASGRFHHDDNPVLNWMSGNTLAKEFKGNLTPTKQKNRPDQKIDGIVALLMGISRAMIYDGGSSYENEGILLV